MMILLLAKANPDVNGHKPVWALQGGNTPILKEKILEFLRGYSINDEIPWTDFAEDCAEELFPDLEWSASDVYFFSIPDGVEFEIKRDSFGNEVAVYYFQGGNSLENVRFAEEIQLSDISNLL